MDSPAARDARRAFHPSSLLRAAFALAILLTTLRLGAAEGYLAWAERYAAMAREEVESGNLSGVSVAMVHDQEILFAAGFGFADETRRKPAAADTVYRVGSISKLFTAISAMQLAERHRLDIDGPVHLHVAGFHIVNPFRESAPITLRQLMCHRSGMVREAPVGGYFDPGEPTAAATVDSLSDCVLVYPPNTRTKYSNSGLTLVGRAVELASGQAFAEYQQEHILHPLGMTSSAFLLNRDLKARLAQGRLQVANPDGHFREIIAPHFEFGILPAGNLYSTVEDLSRFLSCLFAEGRGPDGPILKPGTLAEMWTVQLTGAMAGFGLGFAMGDHRGLRTFGHTGAVYGFTSQIVGIPAHRLGVVVLASDDLAIGAVRRLTRHGLNLLLETRGILPPEPAVKPAPMLANLTEFMGEYESESYWARVERAGPDDLSLTVSNQRFDLTPSGPLTFRANGRLAHDVEVRFARAEGGGIDRFTCHGQEFRRADPHAAGDIPEEWRRFIGSYGPDFIPLIISAKHGHLYAMTENEYDYRLHPLNRTVFRMPPGLYEGEHIVFQTGASGRVHGLLLANMPLRRRR
jgi:CubicO group peptidase (beta-lactamase class C family)